MIFVPFLVASAVCPLVIVSSAAQNCDIDRMDRCAQNLYVYGSPDYKFAENFEEAEAKCAETLKAEVCVKSYAKRCVKLPFVKQYLKIMLKGPSGVIKKSCSQQGIQEYLQHKECLKDSKNGLDACSRQAIHDILRISKAPRKDWIGVSCCFLDKSTSCSVNEVKAKCDPISVKYMVDAIEGYNGDSLKSLCGQNYVWTSQKCVDLMKKVPELEEGTKQPLSVLPPSLALMEKFLSEGE